MIADLGNVDIYYNLDPNQPIMVSLDRIRENPSYHLYPTNFEHHLVESTIEFLSNGIKYSLTTSCISSVDTNCSS
ncbi:unnamed protein product [Cunninghamella echinulata]